MERIIQIKPALGRGYSINLRNSMINIFDRLKFVMHPYQLKLKIILSLPKP